MIARFMTTALGVWLMAAPAVLGYAGKAADNDRITGPLVITFSVIAFWEVTRGVRYMNTLLGAWLLLSLFILSYPMPEGLHVAGTGLLIFFFSLYRGKRTQEFGGGWSVLWK